MLCKRGMAFDRTQAKVGGGPGASAAQGAAPGRRTLTAQLPPRPSRPPEADLEPPDDLAEGTLDETLDEVPEDAVGAPSPDARGGGKAPGAHDLTSPRFAGDATLEACYDDQARLTVGARGESVQKVQQALVDLGYALGPSGADGSYGNATWNAVKKFKATEKLGWEHMGDVGPGTMGRLDELFGGPSPQPTEDGKDRATDGGQVSALDFVITDDGGLVGGDAALAELPEPDEGVITALMSEPDAAELQEARFDLAPTDVQAPGVGGNHVSIAEAIKRFEAKVDVANPGEPATNVHDKGQFFWGRQLGIAVKAEIDALASEPGSADFVDKATKAWTVMMNRGEGGAELRAAQLAAAKSKSPAKKRMQKLLGGMTGGGAGIEAALWAALNKRADDTLPDFGNIPGLGNCLNLLTLRTLRRFDKVGCTVHVIRTAERLKKKGGITARTAKAPFFAGLMTGTGFRDRRPVDGDNNHLGDVVNQHSVAAAVAGLKAALDAGQVVHARLLSGVGIGSVTVPAEPRAKKIPLGIPGDGEHSVLIIGYDGDQFVFSDPDASVSKNPKAGFGSLFFDGTRLSTAPSEDKLKVNEGGDHPDGEHRYQVLFLASV